MEIIFLKLIVNSNKQPNGCFFYKLKDIIREYNLKDTKRINIYLKKIYRTNIKELKKENNLRNINTSEGDKKLKIKSKE